MRRRQPNSRRLTRQSIFKNPVAVRLKKPRQRSFWVLASFRLSNRPLRACSFAKASPKVQKSSLRMATVFFQTLHGASRMSFMIFQRSTCRPALHGVCATRSNACPPVFADGHHCQPTHSGSTHRRARVRAGRAYNAPINRLSLAQVTPQPPGRAKKV